MKIRKYYSTQDTLERYHKLHFTLNHPMAVKKSEYKRTRLSKMPDMPEDVVMQLMDMVLDFDPNWPKEYKKAITTYKFLKVRDTGKHYFLICDNRLRHINDLYVNPQDDKAIYALQELKTTTK